MRLALLALVTSLALACASASVNVVESSEDRVLRRPDRIWVYDVAATPEDVDPSFAGHYHARDEPLSEDQLALGRELGSLIAEQIVEELRELGLPAERAAAGKHMKPAVGDVLVRGEFVDIDEGSRAKRMLVGFGAGAAELRTHFFAYVETELGHEQLGKAEVETEGGKMPGMLLSMGVGAVGGAVVRGAAIGGGVAAAKEFGPESIQAAAGRTAEQFMEVIKPAMVKRGWITEEVAD